MSAGLGFLWDAFQTLNASRQTGMSAPQPIAVAEVMAFCAIAGIGDVAQRMAVLHAVQRMDAAFLKWVAKEREKKAGPVEPV